MEPGNGFGRPLTTRHLQYALAPDPISTIRDHQFIEHHVELQITLGHQLLQTGVLLLELAQALHIEALELTETLTPSEYHLVAYPELVDKLGNWRLVALLCSR